MGSNPIDRANKSRKGLFVTKNDFVWYKKDMVKRIWESLMFSLEWRLYAFVITSLFLWASTGELAFAAVQALGLQVILFIGHTTWYYFRKEGSPGFTLERAATRLASVILGSFRSRE